MSSVHTPPEKKRLSYERDHRVRGGESDKAFRRKWPIKKRKASRSFRHAAESMTRSAKRDSEADIDFRVIKKQQLAKWGVASLADTVAERQALRARRVGAKIGRKRRREQ